MIALIVSKGDKDLEARTLAPDPVRERRAILLAGSDCNLRPAWENSNSASYAPDISSDVHIFFILTGRLMELSS